MKKGLTNATAALLESTNNVMEAQTNKTPVDPGIVLKANTDCLRLMTVLYSEFNLARRQNIKAVMKDTYKGICGSDNPVSDKLFGEDISKKMKDIRDSKNAEVSWKEDRYSFTGHARRYGGQGRKGPQPQGYRVPSNQWKGKQPQSWPQSRKEWQKPKRK